MAAIMNQPDDRILPPPGELYRPTLPPLAPPRWDDRYPRAAPSVQLPPIHSISRSSSPAQTMLPTPSANLPAYFPRPDESPRPGSTSTSSRYSPPFRYDRRPMHPPRAQVSPPVKYEPDVSPPLRSMPLPPPEFYRGGYEARGRSMSDAAVRRQAQEEEKEQSVGQTRRLAHLMSEQKRRESINTGFAALRNALPSAHPTDSKAVVLRKAVARIQQLEQLAGLTQERYEENWPEKPPPVRSPDGYAPEYPDEFAARQEYPQSRKRSREWQGYQERERRRLS